MEWMMSVNEEEICAYVKKISVIILKFFMQVNMDIFISSSLKSCKICNWDTGQDTG